MIVKLRKRATATWRIRSYRNCTQLDRIAGSLVYTVKEMGMLLTATEAMGVR